MSDSMLDVTLVADTEAAYLQTVFCEVDYPGAPFTY